MSRSTAKIQRLSAFEKQKGLCHYCGTPMWLGDSSEFAAKHGLTEKQARRFQCTAEHLTARLDGGTDAPSNIVAACRFCNSTRDRATTPLLPRKFRERVVRRMSHLKWHPREYRHMLAG